MGQTADDIAIEALRAALADSGLTKEDLDGLLVQPSFGGQGDIKEIGHRLGLEPRIAANASHHGESIQYAAMLIASGMASVVACVYGTNQRTNRNRFGGSVYHLGGNFDDVYGLSNPGAVAAFNYRRRIHDFGATEEQLGAVAVAQSHAAALNPLAVYREPLTIDDYINARYVIAPLRLVDFCMVSDGGFAVILTSAERAADLPGTPVTIVGMGAQSSFQELEHPQSMYHPSQLPNAEMLWGSTGLGPADIDALYVQDSYTPNVLSALENYGFCDFGTAQEWIQGGRIELDGELPVNPHGGQNRYDLHGGLAQHLRRRQAAAGPGRGAGAPDRRPRDGDVHVLHRALAVHLVPDLSGWRMTEYAKPIPVVTELNEPHWEGARRGEFLAQRCTACGHIWFPPSPNCSGCLSTDYEWAAMAGTGTVYSFIVYYQGWLPGYRDELPYNVAIVELDEGVRFINNIVEVDNDAIEIGMPVEVVFEDVAEDVVVPRFRPVAS